MLTMMEKVGRVLVALERCDPIVIKGVEYIMDVEHRISIIMKNDDGEDIYIHQELSINRLANMISSISKEEWFDICSHNTLNK